MLFDKSSSMREVTAFVDRAGTVRAGVMIVGEGGSGRSALARTIHARQPAAPEAFFALNCGGLIASELERELFGANGHRDGTAPQAGDLRDLERISQGSLLSRANGGTLYLQNVIDAPARVQAKLARILRDGEVVVDAGRRTGIDIRPIVAVAPDIEDAVREGRLREDLFRRVSALRVQMPALRDRREDIPALAEYFVDDICRGLQIPGKRVSGSALLLLCALPWRGNATELRSVLESVLVTLNGQREIRIEDILARLKLDGGAAVLTGGGTLRQARARFERDYISAVLEQHHGRVPDAARTLGIQRTNLYRKMRSLQVGRIKNDTNPIES
jgi:two-component system nitrogen regulation response regulator NtrX